MADKTQNPKLPPHVLMMRAVSTNVARYGYDPVAKHLYVDFGTPKEPKVYRHDDVPIDKYEAFRLAPSKGQHHGKTFRNNKAHPTIKVDADPWIDEPPPSAPIAKKAA